MTERKTAQEIADTDLDEAKGGYSVPLENATIASIRSEATVIEYQDGDDLVLRKRPGRSK